ncbi:MAG: DUF3606 domain-containing protein [Chitinophagaceae bacterium]|nr:DUF3606 domain-containing protein [Chitinophagaceae bacterium]
MNNEAPEKIIHERSWVNIYEEWDVAYWLKELGCTRNQLERAVTEVGTSAGKVKNYLISLEVHS